MINIEVGMPHRAEAAKAAKRATDVLGLAGLAASVAIAGCSFSLARFQPGGLDFVPGLGFLRGRLGRQVCLVALFAAMACLGAVWWFLRGVGGRRRWVYLGVWLIPLLVALPTISSDLYNYAEQGWALLHGADPTIVPAGKVPGPFQGWAGYWVGTTVRYPQVGLELSALSVLVGFGHQYPTLVALRFWPLLGLLLLVVAVIALSPDRGPAAADRAWLAAANPVVLIHGIVDGHSDLLAASLVLLGIAWFEGRLGRRRSRWSRWSVAAALWLTAGLIKPTALLLLAVLPWLHRRAPLAALGRFLRLSVSGVVVAVSVAATTAVTFLLPGGWHWLSGTGDPGTFTDSLPRVLQMVAWEVGWHVPGLGGVHTPSGSVIVPVSIVLTLLVIAAVVVSATSLEAWAVVIIVLVGLALLGPASRPWYFLGIAPSLALLPATGRREALLWLQFLLWGLARLPTLFVNGIIVSLVPWVAIGVVAVIARLDLVSRRAATAGASPRARSQVVDREQRDVVGRGVAEELGEETHFALQTPTAGAERPEPVTLTREHHKGDWQPA